MDESATAHWRKESHFVAGVERGVPGSEFLIARSDHGRAVFGKFGKAAGIDGEELLDGGSVSKIQRFLDMADDVFQTAEEEDLDANSL